MPATEIYTLTLGPDVDLDNASSAAACALKDCRDILTIQDGVQKVWFSTGIEDPKTLQLFINWNSKTDNESFTAANTYRLFLEKLRTLTLGVPNIIHANFCPSSGVGEALSAPVTQVATFYYDSAPPDTAYEGAKILLTGLEKEVKILGWAFGITNEVLEKQDGEGGNVKGRASVLLVGWETVEDHVASHDTRVLKENLYRLTTPEVKGLEMHHVTATAFAEN